MTSRPATTNDRRIGDGEKKPPAIVVGIGPGGLGGKVAGGKMTSVVVGCPTGLGGTGSGGPLGTITGPDGPMISCGCEMRPFSVMVFWPTVATTTSLRNCSFGALGYWLEGTTTERVGAHHKNA